MAFREKCVAIHEPNAGPAAMPRLPVTPSRPMACPRRSTGTMSAMNAAVPVGLKPVLNPCSSRSPKKPVTVRAQGYTNPHMKHTSDPNTITGMRPTVSASLPENGRLSPAVSVNKAMMKPLYSPPPSRVRWSGSSGSSRLKLKKNRNDDRHISQKPTE